MDLIFEILLDLILEVSVEKLTSKKIPKLVRYLLLSLILSFFLLLILLIIWVGINIVKDNLIGGIIIILFGLIIIILSILRFRRIYISRKKEEGEKMKENKKQIKKKNDNIFKIFKIFIIILNIIGIGCLIYFLTPYLKHDMSIQNPYAMLSGYRYDACGFALTLGLIPLLIANILAYKYIDIRHKYLYFIPSIVCLLTVGHYLLIETEWNYVVEKQEPLVIFNCNYDGKIYNYSIYVNDKGDEYSFEMDDDDKIPLSEVDYTDKETIKKSVEDYYKRIGGSCQ